MRILAVGAHPDDADIFCAGTLAKCAKRGDDIAVCVLTDGRTGSVEIVDGEELIGRRRREQTEAAKHYGGTVNFLDFGDGELFHDNKSLLKVVDAVRRANPDLIFTHNLEDRNTDHISCGELVTRSMIYLTLPNVRVAAPVMSRTPQLFYWDSYAGINFQPVAYVDITDEMAVKRAAVSCHKSQLVCTDWDEMMDVMARFRGLQANVRHAEGFTGYQTFAAMPDYRNLP